MKKSIIALILVNLVLGNLILYFNDFTKFSIAFSASSILVLLLARVLLSGKWLKLKAVVLSLLVTLLIPMGGFWITMISGTISELSPEVLHGTFLFSYIFGVGALVFAWDKFLIMLFANLLLFLWVAKMEPHKRANLNPNI
jgi:hypothetical protein